MSPTLNSTSRPRTPRRRRSGKSVHPFNWRGWWQFGSGALGDMGCHIMDATFSILHQAIPVKIEVETSEISDTCAPVWTNLEVSLRRDRQASRAGRELA